MKNKLKKIKSDNISNVKTEMLKLLKKESLIKKSKRPAEEPEESDEDEPQMKKFKGLSALKNAESSEDEVEKFEDMSSEDDDVEEEDEDEDDEEEDEDEDDEDEDDDDEDLKLKLKSQRDKLQKIMRESALKEDEEEDEDDEEDDEDDDDDDDDDDEEEEEDDDDEEEEDEDVTKPKAEKATKKAALKMKKNLIYALCCNLDSTATSGEVRNFLSRRGLPVESVQMMQGTAAIIGVEARDAERLVQSADGANYKSNSLVMLLPQNQDSMNKLVTGAVAGEANVDKTKLFVRGLPLESTEEHVRGLFSNKDQILSVDMFYKRNSNVFRGNASVQFANEAEAAKGMEEAEGTQIADRTVHASFQVVRQTGGAKLAKFGGNLGESLRGQTSTMLLMGLPDEVTYAMIKKALPGGIQYDIKGSAGAPRCCFVRFETPEECQDALDNSKGRKIGGASTLSKFVPDKDNSAQRNIASSSQGADRFNSRRGDISKAYSECMAVFNLPFSADEDAIREHFDDVEKIAIPKQGMCVIKFSSIEACQEALSGIGSVQMDGRQLRGEARDEDALSTNVKTGGDRGARGGFRGRGSFGDRGRGRGRGSFGDRGRGGFRGRGSFGDRGRGRGRGSFGDRGRGRGSFGDRGRGSFRGRGAKHVFDDSD